MRAKSLVTLAVCALLVFGFAIKASAQVTHQVSSTPVDVIQTGVTEVLGEVRLVMINNPSHANETTIGGTINVLYQDVPITNLAAFGALTAGHITNGAIDIVLTGGYLTGAVTAQAVNTAAGGLVTLSIPAGLVIVEGDTITINGVRATVTGKPVGADVDASIQSLPSNSNSFINVSTVRVARTNVGLVVDVTATTSALCLDPNNPTITLTEGFPGAFVQHVTSSFANAPVNPRPKYGANGNTQIKIQVVGVPSGVTLTFPDTVTNTVVAPVVTWSQLNLVRSAADTPPNSLYALYEYSTTNQGTSDTNLPEIFTITPTLEYTTASSVGTATVAASLWPTVTTAVPRFVELWTNNPPDDFFTLQKCRTYILFPFLSNAAGSTFDSGVAIANTSDTDGVPGMATTAQHGSVTAYGFPQFTSGGTAPTPVTAVLAADLESGNTVANSLSAIPGLAGFQGYVIVVCEFQFGHGFAFLTGTYGNAVPVVAQGYLGIIIPDPVFTNDVRRPASPNPLNQSGEDLGM